MADVKISVLPASTTPLAGTEVLPIVQSGVTKQVSVANLTAGRAISATQITSTIATGTAPLVVTSTTEVANLKAATATSANAVKSNATTGLLQITGPAAASTRVMTTPDADFSVGYLNIPQNSQSVDYTLALTDSGKHIFETGASKTITIPANGSIPFPIGSAVTIVANTNSVSIAITSDTLRWAVDGSTGTRTLAAYGIATILKTSATEWLINGTGVS